MNMQMLRTREGLHAPLKIAMERQAFKTVGRLPCLQSRYAATINAQNTKTQKLHFMIYLFSNAHLDVLSGRDELIDFTDFLGGAEFSEKMTNPHAVVAKHFNII